MSHRELDLPSPLASARRGAAPLPGGGPTIRLQPPRKFAAQVARWMRGCDQASRLRFFWADACGNRFLMVLGRPEDVGAASRRLLRWGRMWPFDSVLALEQLPGLPVRMRILEQDRSESTMCGNGARAVGRLLDQLGLHRRMATKDGRELVVGRTPDGLYSVPLGQVIDCGAVSPVPRGAGPTFQLYSVCGEPHALVLVSSVRAIPLRAWARFTVPWANCTVVAKVSDECIEARTFERGVSRETLSCGTGATAAALLVLERAASTAGSAEEERTIHVRMRGGVLRVRILPTRDSFLEGPAQTWELA